MPINSSIPPANYDEQLGFTLTQNFSSLSYNVTAVEQQDAYGYGPAYLLNGLSNVGYWYQVGLSWDWPIASGGYFSGFGFNYEVFSPNGSSIFPLNAGGLANFSGPVDRGNEIGLSLSFNAGSVIMRAIDWETNSIATTTFQSFGADTFVGLPNGISNSRGFFTGLMTEEYHVTPYNGSETKVVYSSASNVSSAWMWVDEFNANTSNLVFLSSTPTPISYTAVLGKWQYFFFQGATLISNAYEFVTGTSGSVLLTVSYRQVGGTPPVAPEFLYSSSGTLVSAQLGEDPKTFLVDNGSTWSITSTLLGSSADERWTTLNSTSGIASSDQTIEIVYYRQFLENLSFAVLGGGSNFGPPDLTFVSNGRPYSILLESSSLAIWADSDTTWNATNPLPGSSSFERWVGNATMGAFDSSGTVSLVYYHENLVALGYSVVGGGGFSVPQIESRALNDTVDRTLSTSLAEVWLDNGAPWRVNSYLNSSTATQRWVTPEAAGTVNTLEIFPVYYRQSLVSFEYSIEGSSGNNNSAVDPPMLSWISFGQERSTALNSSLSVWADYGTSYSYPGLIAVGAAERLAAYSDSNGTILSQSLVAVKYQTQYYVAISQPRERGGEILSLSSGWYNSSDVLTLFSLSDPGWKLGMWSGTGTGSYSGNSTNATIRVNAPITETAVFYPALTIASGNGGTVSFSYDGKIETVDSGRSATIYVPPLSVVSLSASSSSVLELFTNWHGAVSSASKSIVVQVHTPEKVEAAFDFNYPLILVSVVTLTGAVLLIALSVYRRRLRN